MSPFQDNAPDETDHKTRLLNQMRDARERSDRNRATRQTLAAPDLARVCPGFDELPEYQQIVLQKTASRLTGIENPFYRRHETAASATTQINGRGFINFASYDYLGTNTDPRVLGAAHDTIDRFGISASASRLVSGERPAHAALESALAETYETQGAVCFVSGYLTNVSVISCLTGPQDLVIHDELIHNSVLAGIRQSGATRRFFRHNDAENLDQVLRSVAGTFRRVLVVLEGLYSMDGDVADLPAFLDLKDRHGFWLMVDEAHSLGVLGKTGRGSFEHFGICPSRVDIWMGTLSKTLAACGGYVAGSAALIDLLKAEAGGFVYSVGLAPALASAALASLDIMKAEPDRCARLRQNGALFLKLAQDAGLDTGLGCGFSVAPVLVGDSLRAVQLSNDLLEDGVNALPIIHPAIPEGQARLRFFITSAHTEDQIRTAVALTASRLKALESQNFGLNSLDLDALQPFLGHMDRDVG